MHVKWSARSNSAASDMVTTSNKFTTHYHVTLKLKTKYQVLPNKCQNLTKQIFHTIFQYYCRSFYSKSLNYTKVPVPNFANTPPHYSNMYTQNEGINSFSRFCKSSTLYSIFIIYLSFWVENIATMIFLILGLLIFLTIYTKLKNVLI